MKPIILLISTFIILNYKLDAQVLNGEWVGSYSKRIFSENIVLKFHLNLTADSIISGKSHLYYPYKNFEHHSLIGS